MYNDDKAFLFQHLSEFSFLADFRYPLPVNDELTRGMVEMCKTKKVPIWLAFAAQIYLGIKNICRSEPARGYNDLRISAMRTKQMITDHFKFHQSWPDQAEKNWPNQNDKVSFTGLEFVKAMLTWECRSCKRYSTLSKHLWRKIGS